MLFVTIELIPGTITSMSIANTSNLADVSDYEVAAMEGHNPLTGQRPRPASCHTPPQPVSIGMGARCESCGRNPARGIRRTLTPTNWDATRRLSLFGGAALLAYETSRYTGADRARSFEGIGQDEIKEACDVKRAGVISTRTES
jgi:hypothetical protein